MMSPAMVTAAILPAMVSGSIVAYRWEKSRRFQSPADFLVIPLVLDLGIWLYPTAFSPLVVTSSFANLFLAVLTGAFLIWNVTFIEKVFESSKGNEYSALILGWGIAIAVFTYHFLFYTGVLP